MIVNSAVVGDLCRVSGGFATGQVITTGIVKRVGQVQFDELILECPQQLGSFVLRALTRVGDTPVKFSGCIAYVSAEHTVYHQLQFNEADNIAIHLPSCHKSTDSESKPVAISLRLAPLKTTLLPAPTTFPAPKIETEPYAHPWLSSEFALTLDGLEEACAHITDIEPLMISHQLNRRGTISSRGCSNLVITLPLSRGEQFIQWYREALQENNIASNTRQGTLTMCGEDVKLTLSHVALFGINESLLQHKIHDAQLVVSMCVGSVDFALPLR